MLTFLVPRGLTPKWPVLLLRVAKTNGPSETLRPKLPGKAFRRSADPPFSFRLQEWPNLENGVAYFGQCPKRGPVIGDGSQSGEEMPL